MSQTNIWWIRRDIRLHDNQTLAAAIDHIDHLVPVFIIENELMEPAAPKRRAFLLNALSNLDHQLQKLGSRLVIRHGPALQALRNLSDELDGAPVFAHEDFSPYARHRDSEIMAALDIQFFPSIVLRHPTTILKDDGDPYIVFTPYKNKWHNQFSPTPADCLPAPKKLPPVPDELASEELQPAEPVAGFPGTVDEALQRLTDFTHNGIRHYQSTRNRLDLEGTSRLSPYLRFGLISAREAFVHAQIAFLQAKNDTERSEIRTWIDELVWREFYTAILFHFPKVMDGPFREDYQGIRWREAPEDLSAWQEGRTGYPIVDACMNQLRETGWMHNRGRMIVASFLTKDLLINWQSGEAWFMDNLVDGDPAANNGGWQWSAGTGTDAAPYFRIFNPVLQGQKYDPDGAFIAQWVPALKNLPVNYRHEPWKMNSNVAEKYDFQLGKDYPHPIVDHQFARDRTLEAYKAGRNR